MLATVALGHPAALAFSRRGDSDPAQNSEGPVSGRQIDAAVVEAIHFATGKHRDQRRKDVHQSPFINHPIEAMHLLVKVGGVSDDEAIMAAVLHDTLEDTSTTPAEIEQWFGKGVRQLVEDVTDPPTLSTDERRRRQLAQVRTASPRARLIRLADKVANLAALPTSWTPDQRHAYLTWMGEMAAALGGTNAPLEAVMAARLKAAWKTAHHEPADVSATHVTSRGAAIAAEVGKELGRLFGQLQTQMSNAEELADAICQMLQCLGVKLVRPAPKARPGPALANKAFRKRRLCDPMYVEMAKPGIGAVVFSDGPRDTTLAAIDGAPPITLTAGAAALLAVLAAVPGCADDGFAPYVSLNDLRKALEAVTGRPASAHAIIVGVSRLREQLLEGSRSPMIVQTTPKVGIRLRQRRSSATADMTPLS